VRSRSRKAVEGLLVLAVVALVPGGAGAFIYPEHRDITAEALRNLTPDQQTAIAELWAAARKGRESRFCSTTVAGDGREKPSCIDLAAWPAIAGDHSCSPDQLIEKTLSSDWILKVGAVGAKTQVALEKAKNRDSLLNVWADSNLQLQFADPEYATRAGTNTGHFLMTRTSDDVGEYLKRVLAPNAEPSAVGLYVSYHLGALALAQGWATADPAARPELARRILATEAFALHFLEDSFAAGHVAGNWGDLAERWGTHDYYSEFGLDTSAWNGRRLLLGGDAHLRPEDLTRTAKFVGQSLASLASALHAETPEAMVAARTSPQAAMSAVRFDSCTATKLSNDAPGPESSTLVLPLVAETPMPGRGETDIHLPRFRKEVGPFIGFAGEVTPSVGFGGFQSTSGAPRPYGAGELGVRVGVGLDALTGSTGAGQAFLGIGYQFTTSQHDASPDSRFEAAKLPLVPARRGLVFRLRMPFYLVPFDLLLAAPILVWASPSTLTDMAIVAASGGALPWHRALNTSIGAFQFLLGREVAVTLFGYLGDRIESAAIAPEGTTVPIGGRLAFISYRSLQLDLPTLEYRPLRTFATHTALTFAVILGWGIEFPNQVRYISALTLPPAVGATPDLGTAWIFYVRLHFDARYYF
jgi:hypothetical protein